MNADRQSAPLSLRLAVRWLPAEARDEVMRELLEQHARVRSQRGRWAAARWAWRQPVHAFAVRERPARLRPARSSQPNAEARPLMIGFREDLVVAQRSLSRRPALSLTVIATVAISVGAIAAIASVIDAVLLRPLPFPNEDELVWVSTYHVGGAARPFERSAAAMAYGNPLDVVDWERRERHLQAITPFETFESTVQAGERPLRVDVASVRATVADLLRIAPLHGRLFSESDYAPASRVLVLSHRLWSSAFGADPAMVGSRIPLAGEMFEVIGVLPRLTPSFPTATTDVWVPLRPPAADFNNRGGVWQRAVARMDPGVPIELAQADIDRIARELSAEHPDSNRDRRVALVPFREGVVGTTGSVLALLGGAVVLVLLIACANVGHLLLVSAQARTRELAVRSALGARVSRLARLLFVEAASLAAIGGALGLIIAPALLDAFVGLYPEALPAVGDVSLRLTAVAAAIGATGVAAVLAVVPAILKVSGMSGGSVMTSMRATDRGSDNRGERRVRAALVVAQVALSTMLLVGGGLLLRSFLTIRATDTGLAGGDVLTFNLALGEQRYPALADEVRFYDTVLEQLRALPGVTSAGMSTLLPLTPGEFGDGFYRVGFDDQYPKIPIARLQNVTAGYLEAVGLPLKSGRTFRESDRAGSPNVVVVNETFQRQNFPDGALGRQIRFRGQVAEIVGIVGDKKHRSLRENPRADMYFPRAQVSNPRFLGWVAIRVNGDPLSLVAAATRAIGRLDPGVAMDDIDTMSNRIDTALAPDRFRAFLIGTLAVVALLLASLGLYGLIAHTVSRDARDIAIRIALGAGVHRTVRAVVRSVVQLLVAGIVIGLAVAYAARALLARFLAGVTPFDPATIVAVVILLGLTALIAAAGPARRASRIDPAKVLQGQ